MLLTLAIVDNNQCIGIDGVSFAVQQPSIHVECAPSSDDTKCYVVKEIQLKYGDRLEFDNMTDNHADKVKTFDIAYNAKIPFIPVQIFEKFRHLEQLQMRTESLEVLNYEDFENAWNLRNLTISDNKLGQIPSNVFARANHLTEIRLDGNQILHLDNYAFNGLNELYLLSLNKNRLITLKSFAFHGAPHLTDLRLEYNDIEVLEPGVFDLPDLLFLFLGNNQIKLLPDHLFDYTQLYSLDLQSNPLIHLGESIYHLRNLYRLVLLKNREMQDFNVTRFNGMKNLYDFQYDRMHYKESN